MKNKKGICYLIGAGPGDPGLLTLRGRELLERAEVVVYDNLVNREVLAFASDGAELIYAGKKPRDHSMSQEDIERLLVEKASEGKRVVRLKGGDPFVFGRGAEECEALARSGIAFEVVPGVSSALAAPMAAGIPVTKRGVSSMLTIFPGYLDPSDSVAADVYRRVGAAEGTKVMLMGMERLEGIAEKLVEGGSEVSTPVAVVNRATYGDQRVVRGTLSDIATKVKDVGVGAPAVVVVGEVASAGMRIADGRPLNGRRIVVTRSRVQVGKLSMLLRDRGADVYEMPLIRREQPKDLKEFAELVQDAHCYEWVIFTSPNGVDAFFEIFYKLYHDLREIGGVKIAAIGAATAAEVRKHRLHVDMVADPYDAETLAAMYREKVGVENERILVVRPEEARNVLVTELNAMGAIVDEAIAYRTVAETEDRTGARERLVGDGADMVVFTSSSTVRNFFELKLPVPSGLKFASIGPVTTATMNKFGQSPVVEAIRHDVPGLVEAITEYFSR